MILYAKLARQELMVCTGNETLDTTLAAGLLRACGLQGVRLTPGSEPLQAKLEERGLQVGASGETPLIGAR